MKNIFEKITKIKELLLYLLYNQLKERDREIIKHLFGIETKVHSIEDAGKKFDLTQQRIGQIRDAAMKLLQEKVGA